MLAWVVYEHGRGDLIFDIVSRVKFTKEGKKHVHVSKSPCRILPSELQRSFNHNSLKRSQISTHVPARFHKPMSHCDVWVNGVSI